MEYKYNYSKLTPAFVIIKSIAINSTARVGTNIIFPFKTPRNMYKNRSECKLYN